MSDFLIFISFAAILNIVVSTFVIKYANLINIYDIPNHRKIHSSATPKLGGIVIFVCVSLMVILLDVYYGQFSLPGKITYILPVVLLFITGVADDKYDISYKLKFSMQILAASIFVFWGPQASIISVLDFVYENNLVFQLVTIVWIVGVINAYNLLDGVNMLSASLGLSYIISFLIYYKAQDPNSSSIMMSVLATLFISLLVFLWYNHGKAKMFMGDAGSLMIGTIIAIIAIKISINDESVINVQYPMLLLTFPIFETIVVMTHRMIRGVHPFKPDKSHIHHVLLRLTSASWSVVPIIVTINIMFMLPAHLMSQKWMIILPYYIIGIGLFIIYPRYLDYRITSNSLPKKLTP